MKKSAAATPSASTVLTPAGFIPYARPGEFITSGVPWPKGAIQAGDSLELRDPCGRPLPLQAAPMAYWPDGSVKWSLLTTQADISAGGGQSFTLTKTARPAAASPGSEAATLRVSKGKSSLKIDTGVLRLEIDTLAGGFITAAQIRDDAGRWRQALAEDGIGLYVERCRPDGGGRRRFTNGPDNAPDRRTLPRPPAGFRAHSEDPAYAVQVFEQGPLRVGVRITGTHVDARGRRFCPYIIHLYAWRGSSRVDLQHTLVYTGLPDRDLIPGFGLDIHLRLAATGRKYRLAEELGPGLEIHEQITPAHPQWRHARLTQLAANAYRLEKQVAPDCGPVKISEGGRNQGWAFLGDGRAGCLAAVRDFWQQYPKGFSINTAANLLRVELWPDNVQPWDLRRYDSAWHSDLYEYRPAKPPASFPEATHGARGIAKTHELALHFLAAEPAPRATAELAMNANQPLRLLASPEWYCGSQAIGALHPLDTARFPREEKLLAGYTDFMLGEREVRKWYGMVDYGDFMQTHAREDYNQPGPEAPPRRWLYDVGGHAWVNTENRPDQWLWLAFFRTGRRDYLEAALAMTRHNRDIDSYHWGNFKGCGSRHNVNHWGCADKEWRISTPISLRWQHYLTGDAWTREVILETVKVYQSYGRRVTSFAPSGTAALCGLMVKAELSGSTADFTALRNFADVCGGMCLPSGEICARIEVDLQTGLGRAVGDEDMSPRVFFLMGFGSMQTILEVAGLFSHAGISGMLKKHVDARLARPGAGSRGRPDENCGFNYLMVLAHLARQTGEAKYLRAVRELIRSHNNILETCAGTASPGPLELPPHPQPAGDGVNNRKQTCGMGGIYTKMAFAFSAVAT